MDAFQAEVKRINFAREINYYSPVFVSLPAAEVLSHIPPRAAVMSPLLTHLFSFFG